MKYTHKYRDMLCKGTLLVAAVLATVWVTLPAIAYEFPEDGATVTGTIDEMQVVLSSREVTFDAVTASGIIEPTYSGAVIENLGTATITQGSTFTGNSAPSGGVVYNTGNLTVVDSHFGAVGAGNVAANGGAILNTGNATVGGTFTENTASGWGGAIYNSGNLTIADGTTFTNNTAGSVGGAITNALGTSVLTLGADVSFTGNEAVNDGGAIGNYKGAALVNGTTFTSNRAQTGTNDTDAIGGGAMSLGAESTIQIANATFTSNTSGFNGGALGTRNAWSADNSAASLDVSNSTFTGNKALGTVTSTFKNGTIISTGGNGGALDNHFYNSNAQAGYAYVTGSTFTGNEAVNGGAIYNNGVEDAAGNIAKLYVTGSTFTGNTATTDGGAIYNGGELVLAGTNTFSGNTASSIANDIYNAGTLTIDGTTSLDGGIAGTGIVNVNGILNIDMASVQANELNFANGSTLGVTFANSTMGNLNAATIHVDTTANLVVTLARDFLTTDTTENTLAETDITGGNFVLAEVTNALYNVSYDADTQKVIVQRKSQQEQEQEIEQAGGNQNAFNVVEAFTSSTDMGSEAANNVAEVINQLAQTDTYAAVQAVKALAPEEGATRQVVQTVNTNEIFSAMGTHIASVTGSSDVAPRTYALGDNAALYDGGTYSVWAQGLLNKTHKEANSSSGSFTGRSTGIVGGADTRLSDEWLVGLGYAYTHTNMRSTGRHDRILGDNFLAYAQYKPGSFFVQGAFTYGDSKYEEDKNVSGILVDADYHVHSYALNLTTGFEATEWLTPMAGIRYSVLHQEGYKDSSDQRIAAEQNSFFSGLLGAKLQQLYTVGGVRVLPQLHAGVVYDFVSDGVNGRVSLPNGTLYEIQGDRLHRLAAEAGLSFTAWLTEQVEVSCGYEGAFRKDYNSHTGTLKLRYTF